MSSDYQEAIKILTKRKTLLEDELRSLNIAITVLASQNTAIDFSKFTVQQKTNSRPVKIPFNYNSKLKYPAQVLFMLENFGSQTIAEMIDNILLLFGTDNEQKLFNGLTYAASGLYKKNQIDAVRMGKAYKYSLKKKGD